MPQRTRYSLDHLLGNAAVQRNVFPRLTGKIRRTDPDGTSSVPYYSGLNTKTLNIAYTIEVAGNVTPATTSVTFSSNGMRDAVNAINALDASNIEASDLDGFLSIRNRNGGKTHYITVDTASDAAPVLGFEIAPYPGSTSIAGEFASSPTNRSQKNPQGTAALSKDETLDSASINRAVAEFSDILYRMLREQDREVVGFFDAAIDSSYMFSLGGFVAIKMAFLSTVPRIPINCFTDIGTPVNPGIEKLLPLYRLSDSNGDDIVLASGVVPRITNVLWGNTASVTGFNPDATFGTYLPLPSPTALSALGSSGQSVQKVPAYPIVEISGNVVKIGSVPFLATKGVVPGDYVTIAGSTIATPYSHNGDFIIDEVIDESTLSLRPLTRFDPQFTGNDTPQGLNHGTSGLGNLTVLVGPFLNGPGLIWLTNIPIAQGAEFNSLSPKFRIATGVRFKETNVASYARSPASGIAGLVTKLLSSTSPDGASFIGSLPSSDLVGVSVRAQLDALAAGWLKTDRTNTVSATQHVLGGAAATSAVLDTIVTSLSTGGRKLIWEMSNGTLPAVRVYLMNTTSTGHEFVITKNAKWTLASGGTWDYDSSGSDASMLVYSDKRFTLFRRPAGQSAPWPESSFTTLVTLGVGTTSQLSLLGPILHLGDYRTIPSDGIDIPLAQGTRYHRSSNVSTVTRTRLFDQVAPLPSWLAGITDGLAKPARIYLSPSSNAFGEVAGTVNDDSDALEISLNCKWVNGSWVMDDKTYPATVFKFDPFLGFQILTRRPSGPGWTGISNATFDDVIVQETVDQSNPASSRGFNATFGMGADFLTTASAYGIKNRWKIYPKQITLAWGNITGGGVIQAGYGIASVEVLGNALRVHWPLNFAGTDKYVVNANILNSTLGGAYILYPQLAGTDFVDIYVYNSSTRSLVSWASLSVIAIGISVWGIRT